jgi:ABC-2 type transport system permease protein
MRANWRLLTLSIAVSLRMLFAEYGFYGYLFSLIPRSIFQVLFFTMLARFTGGTELMQYAFVGNIVQLAANFTLPEVGDAIAIDRGEATLELLVATPASKIWTFVGRSSAGYFNGILLIVASAVITVPLMGHEIQPWRWLAAFPVVLVIVFALAGLGLCLGSLALHTRSTPMLTNAIAYALMILCGVNIPLQALPDRMTLLSSFLPLTHGLQAVRIILQGGNIESVPSLVAKELMIGCAYTVIGYVVLITSLWAARRNGSLEFH